MLNVAVEFCLVVRHEASCCQHVLARGKRLAAALLGRFPGHIESVEQALEEAQAFTVNIGVGHSDAQLLDSHNEDMRIRGTDIVLYQQAALVLRRGGTEAGMVELQ